MTMTVFCFHSFGRSCKICSLFPIPIWSEGVCPLLPRPSNPMRISQALSCLRTSTLAVSFPHPLDFRGSPVYLPKEVSPSHFTVISQHHTLFWLFMCYRLSFSFTGFVHQRIRNYICLDHSDIPASGRRSGTRADIHKVIDEWLKELHHSSRKNPKECLLLVVSPHQEYSGRRTGRSRWTNYTKLWWMIRLTAKRIKTI